MRNRDLNLGGLGIPPSNHRLVRSAMLLRVTTTDTLKNFTYKWLFGLPVSGVKIFESNFCRFPNLLPFSAFLLIFNYTKKIIPRIR